MDWTPAQWSDSLWRYFLPQIESGQPVYFSIDHSLLLELTLEREPNYADNPIEHLARCCRTLVEIKGPAIKLRRDALNLGADQSHSNVICLIALQIVTAENMTEDEFYTGNAYFPRFRKLLGCSEYALHSSDPFIYGEFEELWNIFRREVLKQSGATPQTITFKKGFGRDVRRGLPLSQALLTGQELVKLCNQLPPEESNMASEQEAFEVIRRNRIKLTDRSKRIVNAAIKIRTRQALIGSQLLDFLKNPRALTNRYRSDTRPTTGNFSIYWSSDIFNPDAITIYWLNEEGKAIPEKTFQKIIKHCENDRYLIFTEEDATFTFHKPNCNIEGGDSILFIFPQEKEAIIRYTLEKYYNNSLKLGHIDCNLPNGFLALYGQISHAALPITISNGGLGFIDNSHQRSQSITMSGGLLIDGRKREYLSPYYPTHFFYGDTVIDDKETIEVDGFKVTLGQFKADLSLKPSSYRAHHMITYQQSQIAFSMSAATHSFRTFSFGYVYANKALSPQLKPVDESIYFLSGIQLALPKVYKSANKRQLKEYVSAISIMLAKQNSPGLLVSKAALLEKIEIAFENRSLSQRLYSALLSKFNDDAEVPPSSIYALKLDITKANEKDAS